MMHQVKQQEAIPDLVSLRDNLSQALLAECKANGCDLIGLLNENLLQENESILVYSLRVLRCLLMCPEILDNLKIKKKGNPWK